MKMMSFHLPKQANALARPNVNEAQRYRTLLQIAVVLTVIALVLPALSNAYWIKIFTSVFICAIAASGVGLLYRQLGLVCLSQYALMGVGGWISLRIYHAWGWPFEACVLAGAVGGSMMGMVGGLPALRLRGLYLALTTLMMAGAFQVFIGAINFPDGGEGLSGRAMDGARLMMSRPFLAETDSAFLRYVLVWLAFALCLIELHRYSRVGRSWALIRKGDTSALSAGVNIIFYQTWAFGLAGFLAGCAGGLLAGAIGSLDGRAFTASESILMFALSIVGGVYNWFGVIIAGLLLRAVPASLSDLGVSGYVAMMFFGVALLHALITAPTGIAGQLADLLSRVPAFIRRLIERKQHD
ncbi:branched-chain amino acid ABC transporter permease [Iodobacter sp.]|uniref:branched-chain amino acid ABC transporter permease n=1 Tax=Iodobacter sp. TaxID=1915058 RepID=UPI0025E1386E|nr:branched-chain amino acid ABC transporter permease [Iodobacter sp.]